MQIENFINYLDKKSELIVSGKDGLNDLEIIEKIYKNS